MPKKTFPIFKEASEYTVNAFWRKIFEDASENKMPKGFAVSKNIIYVNKGSKSVKYELPTSPQEVLIRCKDIFENVLGLQDNQSKQDDLNTFNTYQNSIIHADKEITGIKDVKKKQNRMKLVDEYVLLTGEELKLSLPQKQKIKIAILTGLDLKVLKNIEFDNSKINKIEGLVIKKEKNNFVVKLDV